jgi:hypothetical protein
MDWIGCNVWFRSRPGEKQAQRSTDLIWKKRMGESRNLVGGPLEIYMSLKPFKVLPVDGQWGVI